MSESAVNESGAPTDQREDPSDARKVMLYDLHRHSLAVAYILLFALGWFGAHRFYLERTGTAWGLIALTLATAVLAHWGTSAAALTALAILIWLIVDLFLVIGMVRTLNRSRMEMVLRGTLR